MVFLCTNQFWIKICKSIMQSDCIDNIVQDVVLRLMILFVTLIMCVLTNILFEKSKLDFVLGKKKHKRNFS